MQSGALVLSIPTVGCYDVLASGLLNSPLAQDSKPDLVDSDTSLTGRFTLLGMKTGWF